MDTAVLACILYLLIATPLTNVDVFTKIRRRGRLDAMAAPPVPPPAYTQPSPARMG